MSLGLMPDGSFMDSAAYPNLGFDPAPGLPEDVQALELALSKTTDSMQEAGRLLARLRDAGGGVWVGAAADAFRRHFNDSLVTDLEHAQQSLAEADRTIQNWYRDLTGFKQTAQKLDQEAATARQVLADAEQQAAQARGNPNLQPPWREFSSQEALQEARNALDAAESALNDADAAEQRAQSELNAILQRAEELEQHVEAAARSYASQLDQATKGLAPHKPGLFSSLAHAFTNAVEAVGGWIEQHAGTIHSILSTIAGIAGLIALCTPPPIDVVAGGIALVAGAGAFAMDLANPKTRNALGGLLSGHFTKANVEAAAGTGADLVSAIPGLSELKYVGKADQLAGDAAMGAASIPELASKVPLLAKLGEDGAKGFAGLGTAGASKAAQVISINAHSLGRPVKIGIAVATKVGNIGKDGGQAFEVPDSLAHDLELGWRAKSVATSLYRDAKEAF